MSRKVFVTRQVRCACVNKYARVPFTTEIYPPPVLAARYTLYPIVLVDKYILIFLPALPKSFSPSLLPTRRGNASPVPDSGNACGRSAGRPVQR